MRSGELQGQNAGFSAPELTLGGKSSRLSPLKAHFTLQEDVLTRDGKSAPTPQGVFLIGGYSPVAMQQMLMRFFEP